MSLLSKVHGVFRTVIIMHLYLKSLKQEFCNVKIVKMFEDSLSHMWLFVFLNLR